MNAGSDAESAFVPVVRADDVIKRENPPGRLLIKIDTEGFEHHVIRGLDETLARDDVALIVEITDRWLKQAGSSAEMLVNDLKSRGFEPYLVETVRRLTGDSARLTRIGALPDIWQYDVAFARASTPLDQQHRKS